MKHEIKYQLRCPHCKHLREITKGSNTKYCPKCKLMLTHTIQNDYL